MEAHTIDLTAGSKECFFEDLHSEDKVRLGYPLVMVVGYDLEYGVQGAANGFSFP